MVAPKTAVPSYDLLASAPILRRGDRLILNFNGLPSTPMAWGVELISEPFVSFDGTLVSNTLVTSVGFGDFSKRPPSDFFIAARDYTVRDVRVHVAGGTVHRVPIEITRSGA